MKEAHISSHSAQIWTHSQGHGLPVLLCNGGPGCCDYLGPVAAMIDDVAQVVRFEQRGCGRSSEVGPYDLATCVTDMEAIRQHYGFDQWVVGGHSWGPDLAMAYALTYPDRILGIIGIAGGVLHKDPSWTEQYRRLRDSLGEEEPDYLYPNNNDVNRALNQSWAEFMRRPDTLRRVADLDVPAVYIHGGQDIRPSWPVEQTAALLPKGRFVLIRDAAHYIWLSHANELRVELRRFIEAI